MQPGEVWSTEPRESNANANKRDQSQFCCLALPVTERRLLLVLLRACGLQLARVLLVWIRLRRPVVPFVWCVWIHQIWLVRLFWGD